MTDAQKRLRELLARQSQQRQRMAELAAMDELTDETRTELDTLERGTPDLERQLRAARIAVEDEGAGETRETPEGDAETRERIELRGKARLTEYLLARAQGRLVAGAEAELCAAAGVQGIPLELWDTEQRQDRETRDITPAPGTVGVNLDPIRPAVFANSIAARLGIDMPRVASGTYATGTIATSQTADTKAKSAAIAATAGAITVATATPKRVSARLELTLEDIAAVGQANFESILRQNLSLALSDELDDQAINGAGQDNDLTGVFQRLTDPAAPAAGVAKFDTFVAAFAGGIDGLWANTVKDVAIVCGVDAYQVSAKAFRDVGTNNGHRGDISFADYAKEHFGGWWTNKADAGQGQPHSASHPLPQGPVGHGRQRGDAHGGLPALGRGQHR